MSTGALPHTSSRSPSLRRAYQVFKRVAPLSVSSFVRSVGTAFLTPVRFSLRSGHFRSSFRVAAVTSDGAPLPWYTYPCIDFVRFRDYRDRTVLEFGGGQSTLWWADHARQVVCMEGDRDWYESLKKKIPSNVSLHLASMESADRCVSDVRRALDAASVARYDVIVVDGLFRTELAALAPSYLSDSGMIICDDAEGYGFKEQLENAGLMRVDFFGFAPGVSLPRSTSIFFRPGCFAFSPHVDIPQISEMR